MNWHALSTAPARASRRLEAIETMCCGLQIDAQKKVLQQGKAVRDACICARNALKLDLKSLLLFDDGLKGAVAVCCFLIRDWLCGQALHFGR